MSASQEGQVECVMVLLDKGAKVNIQNRVSGVIIHKFIYIVHWNPV